MTDLVCLEGKIYGTVFSIMPFLGVGIWIHDCVTIWRLVSRPSYINQHGTPDRQAPDRPV